MKQFVIDVDDEGVEDEEDSSLPTVECKMLEKLEEALVTKRDGS